MLKHKVKSLSKDKFVQFDSNKRSLFKRNNKVVVNNLLPWITDAQNFIEKCTQCSDCINVCPEKIVVKGDGGFPNIDFSNGECTFCKKCAEVCNEDIFDLSSSAPWLNKAQINDSCLAYANVYCRSCSESCEIQALTFQVGISAVPQIDNDICTGCGACVAPCPTKAIEIKELK
jgi:ferredoxin-type protein NapF